MSYKATLTHGYDNRFEAVIVCRDYADFLGQTLPYNLPHLDRVVVVTSHDDERTRAVCRKWSVECIPTDVFTDHGEPFNKGAALNIGIQALRQQGWILVLDADIVLPLTHRNMLDKSCLQRDCIYGAERFDIIGWQAWASFVKEYHHEPQFGYSYLVNTPRALPIGSTLIHRQRGYTPIGYYQLFHSSFMHQYELRYPETEGTAENMDVQWALRWPRHNRLMLPAIRVFHLQSEDAAMGANWNGRTTKEFAP